MRKLFHTVKSWLEKRCTLFRNKRRVWEKADISRTRSGFQFDLWAKRLKGMPAGETGKADHDCETKKKSFGKISVSRETCEKLVQQPPNVPFFRFENLAWRAIVISIADRDN